MALHKILLPDGVTELANVKSVTFKEAVNSGVDLRPGCVGSASIEVEVYGAQTNAVSVGDALTYYQIDKGGNQTLIGVFYSEPTIATKNSWKFVAYDAANKLNADFSSWLMSHQASFPMTIYALVSAACTEAGVTLGSASWTLSTENVQAFYADGITCRQVLSYAAELGCKFVRCHSDGKVYFDWYATATNKRIYPSAGTSGSEKRYAYKQDGLSYANYTTAGIDGVAVHPSGEDDVAYIYPTTPTGDNLLNITNNLLLTGADAALYNAAAQAIYNAIHTLGTYCPTTARLFPKENPFRAGDVVAVTDAQGVSFTTVVMENTVTDSDATLTSTGNEDYADGESNTQKAIVQLASDVVRINKLKVDWADIDTAIINYLTTNNVTAQNLTIVDANDNVLATFNANGITLGESADGQVLIDNDSLELISRYGTKIFSIGNLESWSSLFETVVSSSGYTAGTTYPVSEVVSISVNGVNLPESQYSYSGNAILFSPPIQANSVVDIEYKTNATVFHYDLAQRVPNSFVGRSSFVSGYRPIASGNYSAVLGGASCEASAQHSATVGGFECVASNADAVTVGGQVNKASGQKSCVVGGDNNEASGYRSVVVGGTYNQAQGQNQVVFGKYNDPQANYVELVGNGADDNNRSNARTLDWSGNEVLAGGLTTGDDVAVTGDISATGDATIGGAETVTGAVSANGITSSDDVSATGDIIRKLPALTAQTNYFGAKFVDVNDDSRGGVFYYRSNTYGDGLRVLNERTINGSPVSNGLSLYVDDNGNRYVVVSNQDAWQKGLGMRYVAGDSIAFGTTTGDMYNRFIGDWRSTTHLWFTIPLTKPCDGLTATISGSIIVCSNGQRVQINLTNVTPTCYCTSCGVTVDIAFSSAPSYAVLYQPVTVQSYGTTITFS